MGAWSFIKTMIEMDFEVVARKIGASPATGYSKIHKEEQIDPRVLKKNKSNLKSSSANLNLNNIDKDPLLTHLFFLL